MVAQRVGDEAERFRIVFEHSNDAIFIVDPERDVIVDTNPMATRLLGYSHDEFLRLHVSDIHPLDLDRFRAFVRSVSECGHGWTDQLLCKARDGTFVPVEISASVYRVDGAAWMLAMVRDIRARRLAEQRAEELAREQACRGAAEEALRLRDEFFAVASHELRTPIAALQLAVLRAERMLPERCAIDTKPLAAALEAVDRQSRRLARLVESLFDVSRAQRGWLTVDLTDVDLAAVTNAVTDQLRPECERAGCALTVHTDATLVGRWDVLLVEGIVTQLLTNAIKFGAGRPIEVDATSEGSQVRLTVTDHGIGIPREKQQTIFERFYRGVPAHQYAGFGVGLYVARRFVDALGGRIELQSEPGAGSTFEVHLPREATPSV